MRSSNIVAVVAAMAGRDFATWLDSSTMTRISTSKVHGVGVMAIKRIEAGVDPFPGIKKEAFGSHDDR